MLLVFHGVGEGVGDWALQCGSDVRGRGCYSGVGYFKWGMRAHEVF